MRYCFIGHNENFANIVCLCNEMSSNNKQKWGEWLELIVMRGKNE